MKQSDKHLTIHLYRKDEALASIRWAILSKNYTEAIFWGLELYDSNMESDVIQTLASTWVSRIGFGSLAALASLDTLQNADRETWCQILMSWCRIRVHDTTIFHVLIRGSISSLSQFTHSKDYLTIESAFEDTLRRGKLLNAWYLSRAINPKDLDAILDRMASKKSRESYLHTIRMSPLSTIEKLAAICTLLVLPSDTVQGFTPLSNDPLPVELLEAIASWDAEDSLRKRRVFKIKPEAITYLCERSRQPVSESNESDIQENLDKSLISSPYWLSILKNTKGTIDSKREKFYDMFFSDDIPDEWSTADREKSHGRGLGKLEDQAIKQYIHTTVRGSVTLGLWNSTIHPTLTCLDWTIVPCQIQLPIKATRKEFSILTS